MTIDRCPEIPSRARSRPGVTSGFTLLELTIVLVIGAVLISMAALTFSSASTRASARRAAQVFSRDLALARGMAVRGRESVVVRFDEPGRRYEVVTGSGRTLATRRFGPGEDVNLSTIWISESSDSLVFSNRGIADLSGSLARARFAAGDVTYQVTFNAMGASQVGEF